MPEKLFPESALLSKMHRLALMRPEHIPAVAPILLSSEPWASYGYEEEMVERFLSGSIDAGIARVLLRVERIESDGTPVETVEGLVIVHPGFLGGRYLETLAIIETRRGAGLGTMIVDHVCNEAPPYVRDLFALMAVSNTRAADFYGKLGFQDVGELPGLILPDKVERLLWLRFRD